MYVIKSFLFVLKTFLGSCLKHLNYLTQIAVSRQTLELDERTTC